MPGDAISWCDTLEIGEASEDTISVTLYNVSEGSEPTENKQFVLHASISTGGHGRFILIGQAVLCLLDPLERTLLDEMGGNSTVRSAENPLLIGEIDDPGFSPVLSKVELLIARFAEKASSEGLVDVPETDL